jgi:hypothetical protein
MACSTPTDSSDAVAALSITGADTLIVHEWALLTIAARNARGEAVAPPAGITFRSSNPAVATVSPDGVVTGAARGTATIVAEHGTARAQTTVVVRARVTVTPAQGQDWAEHVSLSTGDSLLLAAQFVDVNGATIGAAPVTAWQSSNPSAMSVDAAGLVIAHEANQHVAITAQTDDGSGALELYVQDVGRPATVRFAHVATGVGPITFRAHRLPPVTLEYGQSVDLPVTSGEFYVETDGLPLAASFRRDLRADITPGAVLSLYATASPGYFSILTPAWSSSDPVPTDSVLVRFIQGSTFGVLRQRHTGEKGLGLIVECYFDPGDPSPYHATFAGTQELLLQRKPGFYADSTAPYSAVLITLPAGHVVTVVLVGDTLSGGGYLTFVDR